MKPQRMEHIGIMVDDLDRSIAFYTGILGLTLRDRRRFGDFELAFLRLGEGEIELVAGEPDHIHADAQVNHLAFTVPDLDAAVTELKALDPTLEFGAPIELWDGLRCLFFRGPDGERLELFERK